MSNQGWIGVDFDGTLAEYYGDWRVLGPPVPAMLARVKGWVARGIEVRIFTARAAFPDHVERIKVWAVEHVGRELEVTATKDIYMFQLWDDRAVAVERNQGNALSPAEVHHLDGAGE